jgi:hypothetical protein
VRWAGCAGGGLMTRRRDTYRGGSTIHIPARDSRASDDGPPEALAKARGIAAQDRLASAKAAEEAPVLFRAFWADLYAAYQEVERCAEREGASLPRLDALDWRERLSQIVQSSQLAANDRQAKAAQAMMGRLADAHRDLASIKRYPEDARHEDWVYWAGAVFPSLGRR